MSYPYYKYTNEGIFLWFQVDIDGGRVLYWNDYLAKWYQTSNSISLITQTSKETTKDEFDSYLMIKELKK